MTHRSARLVAVALAAASLGPAGAQETASKEAAVQPVPYPEGFRRWAHVKTQVVSAENPRAGRYVGMHHIYANAQALEGYETGRFADGAMLVFDLLDVKAGRGNTDEGARKFIDVMLKDSRRFAATGGWGYEEFEGPARERKLDAGGAVACSVCHERLAPSDHVISTLRE